MKDLGRTRATTGAFLVRQLQRVRLSGTSALALSTVTTNLIRLISTMVLTRLLAPEVYGITGIITSVFYAITMVTDIGLQAYVVRHSRSEDDEFLDAVYTIHAIRGVVLAVIGMVAAWPLSLLLGKPAILAPLAVASLTFVIDGQVSLHQFRALRAGAVQRFAMIDLIAGVTQTLTAIALAFVFRNVWAIVASMFVAKAVRVWVTYSLFGEAWHNFRFDRAVAADLWRFSRVVGVSSALTLVITQVDKLGLGRVFTLREFGVYVIASSIAAAPTVFANNYASTIVYAAVARAWRTEASVSAAYYSCWGRFFYLYAFAAGALIGGSPLLVALLYDDRYLRAGMYLSILAVSSALAIVTRSIQASQVASGRQRAAIEFNAVRLSLLIPGAAVAFVRNEPMLLVFVLGLVELPVYCFGLFTMRRLRQVRWGREFTFVATMLSGIMLGWVGNIAGSALLAHL